MTDLRIVMLSGGSGTRLWPLSREAYPKQFLPLSGQATLLQETWLRAAGLDRGAPIVVANEEHRFIAAEQLRLVGVPRADILLEPVGRNTAPAIAAAALHAMHEDADPVLLVLPSDHIVQDVEGFRLAVRSAIPAAHAGALVTFGIAPSGPETGYGYIHARGREGVLDIAGFVEKPDQAAARRYCADGSYYWNSGMFLFRASSYLAELRQHRPDILAAVTAAVSGARRDGVFVRLGHEEFTACPAESIDYAVMEKTRRGKVLPADIGWSDIGSWAALWNVSDRDGNGNACHGDVVVEDSRNCYAYSRRLLALVGVDDVVVVETDDAVLVTRRDRVQQVRDVVARLKRERRDHAVLHREVHRPWGSYDAIDADTGFQVKRIRVKPGASLSLQSHQHRAEHWVVVHGTARVTRDAEVFLLQANESTYIPPGAKHRLENPGQDMLEVIEVQSGNYLGEDDIVRYEDAYGR